MIDHTQMQTRLQEVEICADALSSSLLDQDPVRTLEQLEVARTIEYEVQMATSLDGFPGVEISERAKQRIRQVTRDLDLIESYLASQCKAAALPRRLRHWANLYNADGGSLPPVPPVDGDRQAQAIALRHWAAALDRSQRERFLAGEFGVHHRLHDHVMKLPCIHEPESTNDAPVLPEPADVLLERIFQEPSHNNFSESVQDSARIVTTPVPGFDFPFSCTLTFDGLPLIYVPSNGTYEDLLQLAHHTGHAFHQHLAQQNGTVLSPIDASIDEVLPTAFEGRCVQSVASFDVCAAEWMRQKRKSQAFQSIGRYQSDFRIFSQLIAGPSVNKILEQEACSNGLPLTLPTLSSYAAGYIVSEHIAARSGWNLDCLTQFASLADAANTDALMAL